MQQSRGRPIALSLERDGRRLDVTLTAVEEDGRWRIGVSLRVAPLRGVGVAFREAAIFPAYAGAHYVDEILGLTKQEKGEPTGPVGITTAEKRKLPPQWTRILAIVAAINAGVAALTLLPLPGLAGGWLLMRLGELVARRRIPPRIERKLHIGGFAVLVALFALTAIAGRPHTFALALAGCSGLALITPDNRRGSP